jgi:chaperonin cofactor prefoldin
MESLNGLKDNLREIITDVAILKDDRKRCENLNDRVDSTSGNVKVLEVQFESLMGAMARLERQIEKQVKK